MKYDIFFKNNSTNQTFSVYGAENKSKNPYYVEFKEFELPEGMEDGEYTYIAFTRYMNLEDVEYRLNVEMLDSIAIIDGKEYKFKYLKPLIGLMKVGMPEGKTIYNKTNNENIYYKK